MHRSFLCLGRLSEESHAELLGVYRRIARTCFPRKFSYLSFLPARYRMRSRFDQCFGRSETKQRGGPET